MNASTWSAAAPPAPLPTPRASLSPSALLLGGLGVAVAGLLAISYALVPGRLETTTIAMAQGDTATAEATLAQAMASPTAPAPGDARALVNLALELSEPEIAAALLERYVAAHPHEAPALRSWAEVLQQNHQPAAAADALERLYAVTNDLEVLKYLAGIYHSLGLGPQALDTLQRLFDRQAEDSDQLLELAQRRAAAGDTKAALADLLAHIERKPGEAGGASLAGLAAALSIRQPDAMDLAARLGRAATTGEQLRSLAETYLQRGSVPLAVAAATAAAPDLQREPASIVTIAGLEVQSGDDPAALRRLQMGQRAGTLRQDGVPLLIDLQLRRGDVASAIGQAQRLAPDAMPLGFASRLVAVARETGRLDALRPLEPARFAQEPAAAAAIALVRGERSLADGYARAALASPSTLPEEFLPFHDALAALGLTDFATAKLLAATQTRTIDPAGLRLLMQLVAGMPSRATIALPVLAFARDTLPGAGPVWAIVATMQGQEQPVLAWLAGAGRAPGGMATAPMLDLLGVAVQHRQHALAVAVAATLAARTDLPAGWTAAEITILGAAAQALSPAVTLQALAFLARPDTGVQARTRVSELLAGASNATDALHAASGPAARAIVPALLQDIAAQAGGRDGVVARLTLLIAVDPEAAAAPLARSLAIDPVRLGPLLVTALLLDGQPDQAMATLRPLLKPLPPPQQEALLFNVRAMAGTAREMPLLEFAAGMLGASWEAAYQEALERTGQRAKLIAHLQALAAHGTPAARAALASRLAELGDRPAAIAVLRDLAATAPAKSPVVEQLMYLYGPTADPAAIAFVKARAAAADPADFPGWIAQLDYLGSPAAIASSIEARPGLMAHDAKLADAYAYALVRLGTGDRGAQALTHAASLTHDSTVLKALGRAAEDITQPALARKLATQAVALAPDDPALLVQAARYAVEARRSADALKLYEHAAAAGPLDPDSRVDYADALLAQRRAGDARAQYAAALAQLPANPAKLPNARLRARALHGLDRDGEAVALLTSFAQANPNDAGLKADLLQIALDNQQAGRVPAVSGLPSEPAGSPGVTRLHQ